MSRSILTVLPLFSVVVTANLPHSTLSAADIPRIATISADPLIDGDGNDVAWQSVPSWSDFSGIVGWDDRLLKDGTAFRLAVAPSGVACLIHCPGIAGERGKPLAGHDNPSVFSKEAVSLFLDPTGTGSVTYQVALSLDGDRFEIHRIEGGRTTYGEWNPAWKSASKIDATGWTAEILVPWSAFCYTRPELMSDTWRINVARERPTANKYGCWATVQGTFLDAGNHRPVSGFPLRSGLPKTALRSVRLVQPLRRDAPGSLLTIGIDAVDQPLTLTVTTDAGKTVTTPIPAHSRSGAVQLSLDNQAWSTVRVTTSDGREVLANRICPKLEQEKLRMVVSSPAYRGMIFPGQAVTEVRTRLELPADLQPVTALTAQLQFDGKSIALPSPTLVKNSISIDFPSGLVPAGMGTITLSLRAADGAEHTASTPLGRLESPGGSVVKLDDDGALVVDGKRQFFLAWYGGDQYMVSQAIRATWPHSKDIYPEVTDGHIVDVQPERSIPRLWNADEIRADKEPAADVIAALEKIVDEAKKDPATWMYYLADEPEYRGLSPVYLGYLYRMIRARDPWHPVLIISTDPEKYRDCADILSNHNYINPVVDMQGKRRIDDIGATSTTIRSAFAAGFLTMWSTPQAFSYHYNNRLAEYPTWDEYNANMMVAVAAGAKGLYPFLYTGALSRPQLRLGSGRIFSNIRALEDLIMVRGGGVNAPAEPATNGVVARTWNNGQRTLLLVVNPRITPAKVTLSSPHLTGLTSLKHFRGAGTVAVLPNGSVQLDLPPLAVVFLTHGVDDAKAETEATFLARLQQADVERKRPGNVFFGRRDGEGITMLVENDDGKEPYTPGDGERHALPHLLDGVRDQIAWAASLKNGRAGVILSDGPIALKRAVICGHPLAGATLEARIQGEWTILATAPAKVGFTWEVTLPAAVETARVAVRFPGQQYNELYEIELYE